MSTDVLTQLQIEYNQLLIQYFSTYSYLAQRHPLLAPEEIAGLKFTSSKIAPNVPGPEDSEKIPYPLQPQEQKVFEEAQQELAEDLVLKTQQIQELIARLPGIDQDEQQQADDIRELASQVEEMDKERRNKRKEMRQLVTRLDAVIGGMSQSIDYPKG